MQPFRRRKPKK